MNNILPSVFAMGLFLLIGWLIVSTSKFYREVTEPNPNARYESLDGLRGFLALGVFLHHAVVSYYYLTRGTWPLPPSFYYGLLGSVPVIFFFMITGFLFWSKAINSGGRVRPLELYINRVMRLAPLYLVGLATVLLIVGILSGFELRDTSRNLLIGTARLLGLGMFAWGDLNTVNVQLINAGVTWTLQFEWIFYLLLPVLAFLARPGRFIAFAAACLFIYAAYCWSFIRLDQSGYFVERRIIFLFGMGSAQLLHSKLGGAPMLRRLVSGPVAAIVCIICLAAMPLVLRKAYSPLTYLLVSVVFVCLVNGNTMFGLLTSRPAKQLGAISYSVYLLHGIALFAGRTLLVRIVEIGTLAPSRYWMFVLFCGVATILIASVTYRWVEYPFIEIERTRRSLSRRP